MTPKSEIAGRLKAVHPDVEKLFGALDAHIKDERRMRWSLYSEAIDAFAKTTLRHFGIGAPDCVDLRSFRALQKAMDRLGAALLKGGDARSALEAARVKYASFADDVATCEREGLSILGLQWLHMWVLDRGPSVLIDGLGRNRWRLIR